MYTYKIGISAKEHDQFVLSHPQVNLLQSAHWAQVKDNWEHELIGFYQDDKQVAAAACLIKRLPLGMTMIYIPRGPIMDYSDFELVNFVMTSLKAYGKSKRALMIKYDPSLFISQALIGEERKDNDFTLSTIDFLKTIGVEWTGRTKELEQTIQPRFQANIYAKDFKLQSLSKKARQSIRTAQNKGVEIIIGSTELLEDFSALMKKTEERKHISLRDISYYDKLMTTYANQAYITMARLNLPKQKALIQQQLEEALSNQQAFTQHSKPGKVAENQNTIKRLEKELAFLDKEIQAGKSLVPLAATLTLIYGQTSENLYAGMDNDFRQYQAALLTWYHTAEEAFKRGCQWHNLGGVENQLDGGLFQFKARLNPAIEEFAGEFSIPVGPISKVAMVAYNLRKKLRSNP
ncbi:TPA: lipid II:glycine glycyltransferase FemX [Streptococcus equi subsp. zooepidemicus]|nr:lipid II:glycine glycyltransferase FemX [Streptococcus equi subsp. zooepidemicus]HEL0255264.1 lipid II:glycine glycyltransferase FemX [Streptococcus equi subsp. zooepidemicus]HEL0389096.1 lipid II:glycine glycyltransferase FemX [Streptococcus equi subsp. zooepidemicus]HEL0403303.1 lipid II:glycine glycyltransferase FemX [Streptococcus equi subsp. zooepidemicus]HEL0472008.1 lipid II:glycine glycyltransferase FemX [Streptococcus equi subsp. zooepidemicus]